MIERSVSWKDPLITEKVTVSSANFLLVLRIPLYYFNKEGQNSYALVSS